MFCFKEVLTLLFCVWINVWVFGQQQNHSKEFHFEKGIQDTGDILLYTMPMAAGLTILIKGDKQGGGQFLKSFATNLGATYLAKYVINKDRPENSKDGLAFPSGHTSITFQSASFLQRRYGWKYGIPAYLLAGFVAYSRMEGVDDRHDGWDVLGGIVVGMVSTYLFTTPDQKEHYKIGITSNQGQYLINIRYKF